MEIADHRDSYNAHLHATTRVSTFNHPDTLNTGTRSLMCHPDPSAVIVVNDSDQEDCGGSQSDASSVSLIATILGKASGSTRSATFRRGKSKLMSCVSGPTNDTGIRQCPTGSQLHEVIVIDCDEPSDTPTVRF